MLKYILFAIWFVVLIVLIFSTVQMRPVLKRLHKEEDEEGYERLVNMQNWLYAMIIATSAAGAGLLYWFALGTIWQGHVKEWLNLSIRWMHISFGIAWIGASFYFVFLENALNRTFNVREELAGNMWAVHGGGFYYLEKYKLAPKQIPKELHWFKYEAYFTWLTGFCLLVVVYYFNAESMLIDPNIWDASSLEAIALSVGSLIVAWLIYDQICKRVQNNMPLFTALVTALVFFFAWFYCQVFNGRAAYIHFGALLGTFMAANVFFVIIPGQKRMVKAAKKGLPPNPQDGKAAFLRSYTNNYFTLPVLFVMISNHFPSTYGSASPWLTLIGITIGSIGIKHYHNLKEKGLHVAWLIPVSALAFIIVAYRTAPTPPKYEDCKIEVTMDEVHTIIHNRCVSCHSSDPTDEVWKVAPNGLALDNKEQIFNNKDKIYQRVAISKDMPFNNNQTEMTQEERDMISCWISQGGLNE